MVEIFSDEERKAEDLVQEGIEFCENKEWEKAHALFLQAYRLAPHNPKVNSWLGYTTALVERKVQKGLDLTRKALESHIPDAFFYRNLGKIYLLLNNKRAAVGAFAKGLQIDKNNRPILEEWKSLGFRRKVPLPFLNRSHWLNKALGKFTWNLKSR